MKNETQTRRALTLVIATSVLLLSNSACTNKETDQVLQLVVSKGNEKICSHQNRTFILLSRIKGQDPMRRWGPSGDGENGHYLIELKNLRHEASEVEYTDELKQLNGDFARMLVWIGADFQRWAWFPEVEDATNSGSTYSTASGWSKWKPGAHPTTHDLGYSIHRQYGQGSSILFFKTPHGWLAGGDANFPIWGACRPLPKEKLIKMLNRLEGPDLARAVTR
jgi:hypothetical protein